MVQHEHPIPRTARLDPDDDMPVIRRNLSRARTSRHLGWVAKQRDDQLPNDAPHGLHFSRNHPDPAGFAHAAGSPLKDPGGTHPFVNGLFQVHRAGVLASF